MVEFRLLIVEDEKEIVDQYKEIIELYNHSNSEFKFIIECTENIDDAAKMIRTTNYNGAMIDLKLNSKDITKADGNKLIKEIKQKFRIPVVICTGFSGDLDEEIKQNMFTKVFTKGEVDIDEILDHFKRLSESKLIKILGEDGVINKYLLQIFWNRIVDDYEYWYETYKEDENSFQRVVSRNITNYLIEMLEMNSDGEFDMYDPSEVYIYPPIKDNLFTGDILEKDDDQYIVLMPACDLANKGKVKQVVIGKILKHKNTVGIYNDQLIGVRTKVKNYQSEIEKLDSKIDHSDSNKLFEESNRLLIEKNKMLVKKYTKENKYQELLEVIKKICTNNYKLSWHFLPCTSKFEGGVIDFTDIKSVELDDVNGLLGYKRICSISSSFIKDITARFSQYYARQGQPSFNIDNLVSSLLK
ncbi:TPA: hypothetical protein ACX96U_002982 [Clostridium sporogenes]